MCFLILLGVSLAPQKRLTYVTDLMLTQCEAHLLCLTYNLKAAFLQSASQVQSHLHCSSGAAALSESVSQQLLQWTRTTESSCVNTEHDSCWQEPRKKGEGAVF